MNIPNRRVGLRIVAPVLLALCGAVSAQAADIHVLATGALSAAFKTIAPAFEKSTGNRLIVSWGPSYGTSSDDLPVRIRNHEPMDVCFMIGAALDEQIHQGRFVESTRTDVAISRVGIAVRAGLPKPDIRSVDAVRSALLNARSVAFSEGASGNYVTGTLFPKLGITDAMQGKIVQIKGKELVGVALERGEADMGLQQISELRAIDGIQYVGPLPEPLQRASVISAAVARDAAEPDAARALIRYLQTPGARSILEEAGLDPVEAATQQ